MTVKLPRSALVEIEVIGRARRGFEDADRLAPVIAFGLADREAVQAGEGSVGSRADQGAAGDIGFVAGELRPEGRFQVHVLAHRHGAEVGQGGKTLGHGRIELFQRFRPHQQAEMVLAKADAAGRQVVLGRHQAGAQAHGLLVGGAHAAQGQVDAFQPDLAVDEAEAFGQGHLARQAQDGVAHAGRGVRRIVLERQDGGEILAGAEGGLLQRLEAETDAAIGDVLADVALRLQHRGASRRCRWPTAVPAVRCSGRSGCHSRRAGAGRRPATPPSAPRTPPSVPCGRATVRRRGHSRPCRCRAARPGARRRRPCPWDCGARW